MVSNEEIYDLLLKLSQKVDILEKKLSNYGFEYLPEPSLTIDEWLENTSVTQTYIDQLVSYKEGTMDAFKSFVLDNHQNESLPIYKNKRKSFLAVNDNEQKVWKQLEQSLEYFIQEIWRKFVKYSLDNPFKNVHDDVIDIYKQKIMSMRKQLYEVEKNKREILKWLVHIG